MQPSETFFSPNDLLFMGEAALRSLWISALAISIGTVLGVAMGWLLSVSKNIGTYTLAPILDIFRSVPLIIQLVLFFNFVPLLGIRLGPFGAGLIILSVYTAANVAYVARGGIDAVGSPMRRAARSLGMTYWQDMIYVVWPIGLRAVFPAWVGVALGVMKDSALVSVLGYVELLKASQILMTRTQDIILILAIAGAFYFALSYPISLYASRLEARWKK
jgi:His/Glu/Gln/Arg/opine family amino acid ABC transporter permease subunit